MGRYILALAAAAALTTACTSATDCSAEAGFELGKSSADKPKSCQSGEFADSYRLGETLAAKYSERQELIERADELDAAERTRLRVLERDIPELETLARMRGLMEPAEPEMQ